MNSDAFGYMAAGAALGLGAGLTPGPLLTLVLTQTFSHGTKEGAKVAFTPLLTDGPILCASFLAMSWMKTHPSVMGIISIVGAFVVTMFGYECFKTRAIAIPEMNIKPRSIKKGLLANYMNPHVYIFWATVGAPTAVRASESGLLAPSLFLSGFFVSLIGAKITVAYLAGRFRALLSSRTYLIIMRVLGLALFTFALFLLRDGLRFLNVIN
ncbi:LysE family transporter [Desulfovibrio gilichinskyi]|uniref:Threonine/homoserine/homoserine lactone efflux protein n=1 Tax=Desulfovibrio gilichinskyi TaxID=1519643 RepID=A0A1X7E190_9BACT|nr:LysE family transporter [Desulfovibrio gilichinskyi]SMF25261.1 Threonine/homoserine/homoserine lactone efflux protein [Desulfovibrio gilichinskyi]